jgi:hypothetical protein
MFKDGDRVTFTWNGKDRAGVIRGVNPLVYTGHTTASRKAILRDPRTNEPLGARREYFSGNTVTFSVPPDARCSILPSESFDVPLKEVGLTPEMLAETIIGSGIWSWDEETVPVTVTKVMLTYQVFGQWGENAPPLEEVDALDGPRGELYPSVPAADIKPRR